jgi:hypothetical protein
VSCLATEIGPSARSILLARDARQLAAVACYRVPTLMDLRLDHGVLDLALSLGYVALLLVLIGVSYLSLTRRTKRK